MPPPQGSFEVFLHAGQHKTGTSAIQRFLRARGDEVARQGFYIAQVGLAPSGSHHGLIARLDDQGGNDRVREALAAELATIDQEKVLISAEFSKRVIVEGRGEALIDALRGAGARHVHLILYLRSPFALANALYSQRTGQLMLGGADFDAFLDRLAEEPYFEYDRFLALAGRDDVSLTVRPYSAEVREGAIQDFLATLGIDLEISQEPRINQTYGPVAIAALRQLGAETVALGAQQKVALAHQLFRIGRSISETSFWAIDDRIEGRLAEADRATEEFAQAAWGKPWREAIGEERRPLNLFDPETATLEDRAVHDRLLAQMRSAAAAVAGQVPS
jgi:hypothetical protein